MWPLIPFLLDLLDRKQALSTVRRHRDKLWLLGGEMIRRRHQDGELARLNASDLLEQLIEPDGGPLIYPRISESEQRSLDATCSKLHRFMNDVASRQPSKS